MTTPTDAIAAIVRGQLSGDDIALLDEILEAHGYKIEDRAAPWIEKFEGLGLAFRMHDLSGWVYATKLAETVTKTT